MTRTFASAVAIVTVGFAAPAAAQSGSEEGPLLRKGRVELSTAASFSSSSSSDEEESFDTLNIPLRVGVMVTPRLQLEAEGQLSRISSGGDALTGYQLGAHALYHFGDRRVVPFVLAGAGIGDSVDVAGLTIGDDDGDSLSVATLRAGAGLKAFVGSRAAIRAEYRFTRYSVNTDAEFESDFDVDQHRLFVGVSVFFR